MRRGGHPFLLTGRQGVVQHGDVASAYREYQPQSEQRGVSVVACGAEGSRSLRCKALPPDAASCRSPASPAFGRRCPGVCTVPTLPLPLAAAPSPCSTVGEGPACGTPYSQSISNQSSVTPACHAACLWPRWNLLMCRSEQNASRQDCCRTSFPSAPVPPSGWCAAAASAAPYPSRGPRAGKRAALPPQACCPEGKFATATAGACSRNLPGTPGVSIAEMPTHVYAKAVSSAAFHEVQGPQSTTC